MQTVTTAGPVALVAATTRVLLGEHLLRQAHSSHEALLTDLSPAQLRLVRADPCAVAANLVLPDPPAATEIDAVVAAAAADGASTVVLVDTGGLQPGRATLLTRWAEAQAVRGVRVVLSTRVNDLHDPTEDQLTAQLVAHLTVGVPLERPRGLVPDELADAVGAVPARVRAGVVVVGIDETTTTMSARAAGRAAAQTGAPVVVHCACGVGVAAVDAVLATLKDVVVPRQIVVTGLTWLGPPSVDLLPTLRLWLAAGVCLCFAPLGTGLFLARTEPPCAVLSDDEATYLIDQLAVEGHANQLLISSGVAYRSMLLKSGGYGYAHALDGIAQRIGRLQKQHTHTGVCSLVAQMHTTALELISWWTPPVVKPAVVFTWACDHCGKEGTDRSTQYSKFKFHFCSMQCLRAHLQG